MRALRVARSRAWSAAATACGSPPERTTSASATLTAGAFGAFAAGAGA
jgi:hypothetical protein